MSFLKKKYIFLIATTLVISLSSCTKKTDNTKTGTSYNTVSKESSSDSVSDTSKKRKTKKKKIKSTTEAADTTISDTTALATTDEATSTIEAVTTAQATTQATTTPAIEVTTQNTSSNRSRKTTISFNESWEFADSSLIHSGSSVLYKARRNRKDITIGVNAGHGTIGGASVYTYCHPDRTPKTTGGSTAKGAVQAIAVSSGMCLYDGTAEPTLTLAIARVFRDKLLAEGFDVLMVRDGDDVQLDNVARTIMCNNNANCHIALHIDGDGLNYDKGCFYASVPDGIKNMYPVSEVWSKSNALGDALISGLKSGGSIIYGSGSAPIDLTQTSYSKVPSIDIELGNAAMDHSDVAINSLCDGMVAGVKAYYGVE